MAKRRRKDDQADLAAYHRWLLHHVLIEGRSTVWCANQVQIGSESVTQDFNFAVEKNEYFDSPKRRRLR